ncbi:MAG TPA: ATP-binding protein [Ohtaekwangia sp.]|uniref:ATP-binding protein n=1 Tax=Ohtaekwangia sp. TaxID=2066019 RepID=UPI002F921638
MNCSKAFAFLCLLGLLSGNAFGQSKLTDSLEKRLPIVNGTEKVDLLNQLTYEFITNDNARVIRYNNESVSLSRQIGYIKGEAVAHTYRGVYDYLSGQFTLAHQDLHKGLSMSIQAGDRANQGYTLLQLGVCALEEVEDDSALFYFTKSYEIFKDSTNALTLSKIYRNLSALYGQRYQYDKQQLYLDRSIVIRRLLPDKMLLADALVLKAGNVLTSGDLAKAETILSEAEVLVKDHHNDEEDLNDVRYLRALILFRKGRFEEAVVLVDSARAYYFRKSLIRKYVTLLTDMGKIFSDRGEYELALNNLYDALNVSKRQGFEADIYTIRNRIGWVNFHLGDTRQALRLANEALKSGPKRQLQGDQADALMLKGAALTELNDFSSAHTCLDSVYAIYTRLDDDRGVSDVRLYQGILGVRQKKFREALAFYDESIQRAVASNYAYGLAWAQWAKGDLYVKLGDAAHAAQLLDLSEQFSHRAHAYELLIRTYNTRRDLLASQSQYKESLKFSMLASVLKDSIHRTDLARRFVNLEKTQEIEQRDRDIKVLQKDKQLAQDKIHLQESRLRQQFILLIAGMAVITLLGILAFLYYRFYARIKTLNIIITDKNKRIQAQADELQQMNAELKHLYREVSEQNEEIQAQANKLAESNKDISDLNRGLERIVAEKTLELRTTNEELVKHNNELLQFSYTVSHNLRGPAVRLIGLSELAQAEKDIEQVQRWVELISKTASDLDLIIKDLNKVLDLRNEPDQYLEVAEFEKEWKQCISLLQDSLTGEEEIIVDFHALPKIITVKAMLQSTLYNLLSNAIKFRSPDRKLNVTATSHAIDGKAIIEISDNGLGFDTQLHKEKIFKLYKRFHTHVEGRGIGLYLIKAQIEVLRGTIDVESVPGHGSRFRIVLPLILEESLRHSGHSEQSDSGISSDIKK